MPVDAVIASLVAASALAVLAFSRAAPDFVFLTALVVLMLLGVMPLETALGGFANEGLITVGAMYVVAAGLR
ncbi:MAG TPA: hypothetical protein VF164_01940, partial [Trueperaceae bacterium]